MNLSHIKETDDEFFKEFNDFIRDGNFRVGYSDYAKGLSNLKEYFRESEIALELGTKYNPTIWTHRFQDYMLKYMLNKITEELPATYLCSPILSRLHKYDYKNKTEYVKTLRKYLENDMNAVQTAKDLYIHRATIVYRLDRMKKIGETDFKDADELLHLYLSLRLLQ